ncbi:hypothetical protein BU15DRAFT_72100 [Melanogaster broomeanus]|nr:hypothetical protein BU15DRAFT_72100 [Melanogaster broomeanus]
MSYNKPPFKEPYIEDSQKRVRVLFGGKFVVDTYKPKLVWERPFYPTYFFSTSDLPPSLLRKSEQARPEEGTKVYDLVVGEQVAKEAVTEFTGQGTHKELGGLLKLNFASADAWFEEDERIYAHPKDPYKRVDVLRASRHVRVEVNGVEVADTHRPHFLHETGLRRRTYIPLMDVRVDLLTPSDTTSLCPYKGWANYYNVRLPDGEVHQDIVWYYRTPYPECIKVIGLVAFYDEKVDVWIDGEKQE